MIKKEKIFFILIGFGMITTIIFFYRNYESQEESFYQIVDEVRVESYYGTVINKFYDKFNHGRYKVGDTLIKEKNQLELQIKRKNLDTVVKFKFDNVRGMKNTIIR